MSLVAYGSSDENSEDEEVEPPKISATRSKAVQDTEKDIAASRHNLKVDDDQDEETSTKIRFEKLPKPKSVSVINENVEEDDDIPFVKETLPKLDKSTKKDRGHVKITIPSLSQFKDVEEEEVKKRNKIMPSQKGTGLFAVLPPPKYSEGTTTTLKPTAVRTQTIDKTKTVQSGLTQNKPVIKRPQVRAKTSIVESSYDSNSEDEDTQTNSTESSGMDFFSLTVKEAPIDEKLLEEMTTKAMEEVQLSQNCSKHSASTVQTTSRTSTNNISDETEEDSSENQMEIGPRLPNSQEYNVDADGNIALDEKAIERLCGKRGVKRKGVSIDEANVIEINGEDIKPDERDWLVKALTEEPVQRPISMQSGGVNSQSKKKHQITYLAHQAKAMEMELKNQWAQNRMTRKQTQSKYGF